MERLFQEQRTRFLLVIVIAFCSHARSADASSDLAYPIVDSNQNQVFDGSSIGSGSNYPSQDGLVSGNQPLLVNNNDGTVSDTVTGLMWTQAAGDRLTYAEGIAGAANVNIGGYTDWRVPTTKELYSLIQFSGTDPVVEGSSTGSLTPFIDPSVFKFSYGESPFRTIDVQYMTSTVYLDTVMEGQEAFFGVNYADGRIKGYPTSTQRGSQYFAKYVRGTTTYGVNSFTASQETVTDSATALMWQRSDVANKNWQEALQYCDELVLAGNDDWRLPNAKELHSIVDYSRSPGSTSSAAIDALFTATAITNEAGENDFGTYWTSTTHLSASQELFGDAAITIHFGRALGFMDGVSAIDVHGAGAQRSEPKAGDPSQYSSGRGPQGDVVRIYNMVRCVRDADINSTAGDEEESGTVLQTATPPIAVVASLVLGALVFHAAF